MTTELRNWLHSHLDTVLDSHLSNISSDANEDPASILSKVLDLSKNKHEKTEAILQDNENRYVLLPIKHPQLWELYKRAQSSFWVPEEIDLKSDYDDFMNKMTENERHFIKNILAFFAASDFIINENLSERFMQEVQIPEAKCFYAFQEAIESIHSESYALLLDTLIRDPAEKYKALHAIETIPCIKRKADWSRKWIADQTSSFAKRLVCFAIVEGVHFSGSFCALYWLRKRNLMQGVTFSNSLISRDESLHTEFATVLYNMLENKLDDDEIHGIMKEAVDIETEFICDSIPCALIGMSSPKMAEYIQFVADRLLSQLGHPKLFNAKNPFDFMDMISMQSKTSFFESREHNYSRAYVGVEGVDSEYGTDADF